MEEEKMRMSPELIRLGTRGSDLAMWQAVTARDTILRHFPDSHVEIIQVSTKGDRDQTSTVPSLGVGVFVREIEQALLENRIDAAVHSAKDLPAVMTEELIPAAALPRGAMEDVLVSRNGLPLADLPKEAVIGTSSPRRKAQLLRLHSGCNVEPIRGNVETRLRKVTNGEYQATILARAGLERLNLHHAITRILPVSDFLPAAGQGIVVLQCRREDEILHQVLSEAGDDDAFLFLTIERAFLRTLGAGCQAAVAGLADRKADGGIVFTGRVLSLDGSRMIEASDKLEKREQPENLGQRIAESLLKMGAQVLLDEAKMA